VIPADLDREFRRYTGGDGAQAPLRLWQGLLHVVDHSAQHRGELHAALTAFGSPPAEFDQIDQALVDAGVAGTLTSAPIP
jgi:uncharacterized damage-inducible protein DinB